MSGLIFCTGGTTQSGIGHLMRCQALAQAADDVGLDSVFFVNVAARTMALSRHDWTGKLISAPVNEQELLSKVLEVADDIDATAIVVDGYGYSETLLKSLGDSAYPLVLLDDIFQPGLEHADIIANPAGEVWAEKYQSENPDARLCLGPAYRLLRREFAVTRPLPVAQRFSLTINMGGSDPTGLTLPIVKAITESLSDIPLRVVTGPGFAAAALSEVTDFIQRCNAPIQHIHNCQDMADLWVNARLAVVAAGGTQFELAACQTPSVLLVVAENQRNASEQAAEQGWCEVFDATQDLDMNALIQRISELWQNTEKLQTMQHAAADVAVTDGAMQLLETIGELRGQYA